MILKSHSNHPAPSVACRWIVVRQLRQLRQFIFGLLKLSRFGKIAAVCGSLRQLRQFSLCRFCAWLFFPKWDKIQYNAPYTLHAKVPQLPQPQKGAFL